MVAAAAAVEVRLGHRSQELVEAVEQKTAQKHQEPEGAPEQASEAYCPLQTVASVVPWCQTG
jgi:hypothetical protein